MPIEFRASLVGQINVRFVIRYEVEGLPEDAPPACKFRISRMILFLNSNLAFKVAPFVNMSVQDTDKYIVNFQTWQKMIASWYERPKFKSIEIVRGTEVWQLSKKDEVGNFVTVCNCPSSNPSKQILVFPKDTNVLLDLGGNDDEDLSL